MLSRPAAPGQPAYCRRCGEELEFRHHGSIQKTWALIIAATLPSDRRLAMGLWGTYVPAGTSLMMLAILGLIYALLAPLSGEPVPVENTPQPVQIISPAP